MGDSTETTSTWQDGSLSLASSEEFSGVVEDLASINEVKVKETEEDDYVVPTLKTKREDSRLKEIEEEAVNLVVQSMADVRETEARTHLRVQLERILLDKPRDLPKADEKLRTQVELPLKHLIRINFLRLSAKSEAKSLKELERRRVVRAISDKIRTEEEQYLGVEISDEEDVEDSDASSGGYASIIPIKGGSSHIYEFTTFPPDFSPSEEDDILDSSPIPFMEPLIPRTESLEEILRQGRSMKSQQPQKSALYSGPSKPEKTARICPTVKEPRTSAELVRLESTEDEYPEFPPDDFGELVYQPGVGIVKQKFENEQLLPTNEGKEQIRIPKAAIRTLIAEKAKQHRGRSIQPEEETEDKWDNEIYEEDEEMDEDEKYGFEPVDEIPEKTLVSRMAVREVRREHRRRHRQKRLKDSSLEVVACGSTEKATQTKNILESTPWLPWMDKIDTPFLDTKDTPTLSRCEEVPFRTEILTTDGYFWYAEVWSPVTKAVQMNEIFQKESTQDTLLTSKIDISNLPRRQEVVKRNLNTTRQRLTRLMPAFPRKAYKDKVKRLKRWGELQRARLLMAESLSVPVYNLTLSPSKVHQLLRALPHKMRERSLSSETTIQNVRVIHAEAEEEGASQSIHLTGVSHHEISLQVRVPKKKNSPLPVVEVDLRVELERRIKKSPLLHQASPL